MEQACQPRKGLVPVTRDRPPDVNPGLVESGPAPLLGVAVPIADEDVDQARRKQRARIRAVARVRCEMVPHLLGARDPLGPREPDFLVRIHRGTLLQQSEHLLERGKRSEEHTSELQSQSNLVCRLLLEKKKTQATDVC